MGYRTRGLLKIVSAVVIFLAIVVAMSLCGIRPQLFGIERTYENLDTYNTIRGLQLIVAGAITYLFYKRLWRPRTEEEQNAN